MNIFRPLFLQGTYGFNAYRTYSKTILRNMATVFLNDQPVTANSQMAGGENYAATNKGNHYLLVQFKKPPTQADLEKLDKLEFGLLERIGGNTYVYRYKKEDLNPIRSQTFVAYANVYPKFPRIAAELRAVMNDKTQNQSQMVDVDITMQPDPEMDVTSMITKVSDAMKVSKDSIVPENVRELRTAARYNQLETLANLDGVRAICRAPEQIAQNTMARETMSCPKENDDVENPQWGNKDGNGQTIIVVDHGLDINHPAFQNRDPAPKVEKFYSEGIVDDLDGHGTHCAASALGNGQYSVKGFSDKEERYSNRGSAPGANLYFMATNKGKKNFLFGKFDEKRVFAHSLGNSQGRIISYSFGVADTPNQSGYRADVIDDLPDDVVFAICAGNEGVDKKMATGKWRRTDRQIGDASACKNGITVGACGSIMQYPNDSDVAYFSSRGPLLKTAEDDEEGRIKPDVVAPGYRVLSANSRQLDTEAVPKDESSNEETAHFDNNKDLIYKSGTSMATPLVAGCCAAIRAVLVARNDIGVASPPATLIKAILVNGTVDLERGKYSTLERDEGNPSAAGSSSKPNLKEVKKTIDKAPNGVQGFGRVNLGASLEMLNKRNYGLLSIDIRDNAEVPFPLPPLPGPIDPNLQRTLKVTMCYSDVSTPKGALQHLLALRVTIEGGAGGSQMVYGNRVPGGDKSQNPDRVNNVQKVVWPNLASNTRVTVRVKVLPGTVGLFGKLSGCFNTPTKQVAIAWSFETPKPKGGDDVEG